MKINQIERPLALAGGFFAFLPFFSLFPINTDVQPFFLIFIIPLLIFNRMRMFTKLELLFLGVATWSFIYFDVRELNFEFRKTIGLLVAFYIYHFFRVYHSCFGEKFLLLVVSVSFFSILLHATAPDFFLNSFGHFVREIKVINLEGARGASGLAPEPGFAGALAVFYIAAAIVFYESRGERKFLVPIVLMCISIIVLSRSGSGALLLVIFLAFFYFKFNLISIISGTICLFILYFVIENFDLGRAGYVIKLLFDDPRALFLGDSSVGKRVLNIVVGTISIFEFPFGSGFGSYERVSAFIVDKYELANVISSAGVDNVSAYARYSVEIGLIFWTLVLALYIKGILRCRSSANKYFIVSIYFIAATFSIVFPPTWFLMASIHAGNLKRE